MPATFTPVRPCKNNGCSGELKLDGKPISVAEGLRGTYYCNKCARVATFTKPSEVFKVDASKTPESARKSRVSGSLKNSSKTEVFDTNDGHDFNSRLRTVEELRRSVEECVDYMTEILRSMAGLDHLDPKNLDMGRVLNQIHGEMQTHRVQLQNLAERLK